MVKYTTYLYVTSQALMEVPQDPCRSAGESATQSSLFIVSYMCCMFV